MRCLRRVACLALSLAPIAALAFPGCHAEDNAAKDNAADAAPEASPSPTRDATVTANDASDAGPFEAGDALDPPTFCSNSPCVTQIAAGFVHACALLSDRTLRCWGSNIYGQLGIGDTSDGGFDRVPRTRPVAVVGLGPVRQIGAGFYDTCALQMDGDVYCWGSDRQGMLGNTSPRAFGVPTKVSGLVGTVAELKVGGTHACVRMTSGSLQCWGENTEGQCGVGVRDGGAVEPSTTLPASSQPSGVAMFATGATFTCTAGAGGSAPRCFGGNKLGELGRDRDASDLPVDPAPAPLVGLAAIDAFGLSHGDHGCAIVGGGNVACWGDNQSGQTGIPDAASPQPVPAPVPGLSDVAEVVTSGRVTCARTRGGDVLCWGNNAHAAAGQSEALPVVYAPMRVPGVANATQIALGWDELACALIRGGFVVCWGRNTAGVLGRGGDAGTPEFDMTPRPVEF